MFKRNHIFILLYLLMQNAALWAQNDERFAITHLPYIQALTDSSVSIVWTTNRPGIAWVEIATDDSTHFYRVERPKFFAAEYGFKKVGTVHQVDLHNLKSATRYRYRVYSQEVLKHEGIQVEYGRTAATNVYRQQPLSFHTLGTASATKFAVVNDIHGRNDVMNTLLDLADLPSMDFVVFNGDMVNSLLSEKQMYADFMDTAIKRFASEKPMYYSRGNHETRGPFAPYYPKYFPTPTGQLFYQFRHGNAAIIVLDCGEDKPDSDIEYSGIVDMDNYRSQQADWLRRAVKSPAFISAKYKIVICHIPPLGGWHGEQEILEKFVPILNNAGVQIMLSGHLHRHILRQADEQVRFPVIVNSNNNLLKVNLNDKEGSFSIIDQKGKLVEEIKIKAGQ